MRFELGERGGALFVEAIAYGATIVGIHVPDRTGARDNVVLHYDDLETYECPPEPKTYYGATIGRYANRIAGARFSIDGAEHVLSANEGGNTLHGGTRGFDAVVWKVEDADSNHVTFSHVSPAGDQGFPGELQVIVRFAVQSDTLTIRYGAVSNADTVINLTNHSYFNLSPRSGAAAAEHALQVFADAYTPVDEQCIPTGEIAQVEGTRFDFSAPRTIGESAYDTNWVLRAHDADVKPAAMLGHPASGRMVEVRTSQPGLQVFTGNTQGVALETQHFPDSPHHPSFPSVVLRAGEVYASATSLRFFHT